MKGWRFYEGFKTSKRKVSEGNVVAVNLDVPPFPMLLPGQVIGYQRECVAPVFFVPNAPVCYCAVSVELLRLRCKRISEAKARTIHPKLFEYLEQEQEEIP